ncbi:flagellar biosynthetic protein FliO [Denitratisoma oestradiolicum]|uniref:Flagellar protein n=1 Tax=Denitratisoma oestradiolicum TaxID=311182 RepID=A0A6S6Y507_9PROT|nr:flagellar biosynthetic protein FliO [Denitratisoma oestradiolicum]TWO81589.1 flagellar biosynthetic protein FliO [Denitratisoma oestradiolicum]CAB1370527.1 Flagellar protein [Denitratisoma oestradiolicum]
MRRYFPITALYLALLSPAAQAQNPPATPDLGTGLLQMVLGFSLILALLLGSLWLLKRLSAPQGAANRLLKVVAAIGVGPRERVVVVEVNEKWLVLGVAPGSITTLHELPRQVGAAQAPSPLPEFAARLKRILDRDNAS